MEVGTRKVTSPRSLCGSPLVAVDSVSSSPHAADVNIMTYPPQKRVSRRATDELLRSSLYVIRDS